MKKQEKQTKKICIICKEPYKGFGNNAEPLAKGRCCDICNIKVVAERIRQLNWKGGK